jgi:hypothetical protein
MSTDAPPLVHCTNGHLLDEPWSLPAADRTPCPHPDCGSLSRALFRTTQETVTVRDRWTVEGAHDDGKPFFRVESGATEQADGTRVNETDAFYWPRRDGDTDRRLHHVETEDGAKVVHHENHRLTDHVGHGSDKPELRAARAAAKAAKAEARKVRKVEIDAAWRARHDP